MPRSLADAHKKIAILTVQPVNPAAPTVTELNAGIGGATGVGSRILLSDWTFGPTDSDTFNERAVSEDGNANAYGASNYQCAFTTFRYFNATTGVPLATEDTLFAAGKSKGTRLWVYERETGQKESDAWTAADELSFGAEVLTDHPQKSSETGGYIKRRIPTQVQKGYPNIAAAA